MSLFQPWFTKKL